MQEKKSEIMIVLSKETRKYIHTQTRKKKLERTNAILNNNNIIIKKVSR